MTIQVGDKLPDTKFRVMTAEGPQVKTTDDITRFCRENLTAYKVPKLVEFRTELPKTNVGKILRRARRDEKKAAA